MKVVVDDEERQKEIDAAVIKKNFKSVASGFFLWNDDLNTLADAYDSDLSERDKEFIVAMKEYYQETCKSFIEEIHDRYFGWGGETATINEITQSRQILKDWETFKEYVESDPLIKKQWDNIKMQMRLKDGVTMPND